MPIADCQFRASLAMGNGQLAMGYNGGMVKEVIHERWRRVGGMMSEDASGRLAPEIAAAVAPEHILHDDEVVLILTKPSLWFVILTSFRFMLATVLLGVLAVRFQSQVNLSAQTIGAVTALVCVGRLVWAMLVWSSHTYMLTNQRIVTIKGVLNTTMTQANLRKVQRTVLYRPLYLKIFGIGTVGIGTAATTDFEATWVMIARPVVTHEAIVAAINKVQ
jgi:membrane protein YdbS with pleckstrin-like domain